ncbi:MAG: hypothetical protein H6835_08390 [Planctomycetes bacterium]|nr:hypothetical protein [Planctomycetota bacterium]
MSTAVKPRVLFRIVAVILLLVGGALLNATWHEPTPHDEWRDVAGPLTAIDWSEQQRTGLRCQLTLTVDDTPRRFAVDHVRQADDRLRERLEALQPGRALTVSAIPRDDLVATTPDDDPEPALIVQSGDEVLFDVARDTTSGAATAWLVRVVGGVVIGIALGMLALTRRRAAN